MIRFCDARPLSDASYHLAEGPIWSPGTGSVLWVDIDAGQVAEGQVRGTRIVTQTRLTFGTTVSAVVPGPDGVLLVAGSDLLWAVTRDGTASPLVRVIPAGQRSRLNDGACDPAGRFLVGTLALDGRLRSERLVRLERDLSLTVLDTDLTLSNGLGWSPDGQVLYSVDSVPGVVYARAYDPAGSTIGVRRELFRVEDGLPDGLCVDASGDLWVAIWGRGEVRCYSPAGKVKACVSVAAPHVSSAAFVGDELDRLLITTASAGLTADEHRRAPDSGRLFLAEIGVRGAPVAAWSGLEPSVHW